MALMIDLPQQFGKYVLVERIAIGGMAEIFKTQARGLGGFEKLLAVKRLHPRYSEDQDFIRMLVDEAKIAVQLSHSNIGQIFDLGRENDLVYIAMEYIDGRDLYRVLRRLNELGWKMPIEAAVYIIMEVCAGLDYAHRKCAPNGTPLSIIHRDISPQNVIVSWEGEVKLIDFGIAKAAMRAFETESGVIKGKFYYMSPEQARGDTLDHRSDIFSLGICLYELLTGHTVYREEDDVTLLSRVRRAEISPPTTMRPEIPHDLERIVMKALSRNPRRRYQTAHQLQMALSSFLYSIGRPFNKVQLGAWIRESFDRGPARSEDEASVSYHDRFMSRVDYTADGSFLSSHLIDEDGITAIVGADRDTVDAAPPISRALVGEAFISHDPYAEGVLSEDGELEAAPTRAGTMMDDFGEDEVTWLYPPALEQAPPSIDQAPVMPPPVPVVVQPQRPSAPPKRPAPVEAAPPPRPPAPAPPLDPRPRSTAPKPKPKPPMSADFDHGIHTGMVTGVYNEPTRITGLVAMPESSLDKPKVTTRLTEGRDLYEVPLALKLLFAIGLAVILLAGGTISALAAVLINKATADLADGTSPDAPVAASAQSPGDAPDTRGLVIDVNGTDVASVALGEVVIDKAPYVFESLIIGRSYDLKVTAPNYRTYAEVITLDESMPSGYQVKMTPRLGTLIINTVPAGASIQLDTRKLDKTSPLNLGQIDRTSPHALILSLEGHEPHAVDISWEDAESDVKTIDVSLKPLIAAGPDAGVVDGGDPGDSDASSDAVGEVAGDPVGDAVGDNKGDNKGDTVVAEAIATQIDKAAASEAARERRERRERLDKERSERNERDRAERDRRERERLARERDRDNGGGGGGGASASTEFGTLAVNARPWGQVYVDGARVANETPVRGLRVKTGYHTVKVVFPTLNNKARSKQVLIRKGELSRVSFVP